MVSVAPDPRAILDTKAAKVSAFTFILWNQPHSWRWVLALPGPGLTYLPFPHSQTMLLESSFTVFSHLSSQVLPKLASSPVGALSCWSFHTSERREAVSAHLQGVKFSKGQQLGLFRSLRGDHANGAEWSQWASRPESCSKALFDLEQRNPMGYINYFPATNLGSIETCCFLEENSSKTLKMTSYIHTGGYENLTWYISPMRVISYCLYLCALQKNHLKHL